MALFVAFGGGAAAYASGLISGSQIKNHSIAEKKLAKKAIKALKGQRGARGPAGPTGAAGAVGATGATGATGSQGPQGPAGPTYWVVVSSTGSILRQSGGWTVTNTATGRWTVENPSLDESTMAVADSAFRESGGGTAPGFVTIFANDTTGFHVSTYDSTGTLANLGFSLIATK